MLDVDELDEHTLLYEFWHFRKCIMLDINELDEHTLLTMSFDCNAHIAK